MRLTAADPVPTYVIRTSSAKGTLTGKGSFTLKADFGQGDVHVTKAISLDAEAMNSSEATVDPVDSIQRVLLSLPPLSDATVEVRRSRNGNVGGFVWEVQVFDLSGSLSLTLDNITTLLRRMTTRLRPRSSVSKCRKRHPYRDLSL